MRVISWCTVLHCCFWINDLSQYWYWEGFLFVCVLLSWTFLINDRSQKVTLKRFLPVCVISCLTYCFLIKDFTNVILERFLTQYDYFMIHEMLFPLKWLLPKLALEWFLPSMSQFRSVTFLPLNKRPLTELTLEKSATSMGLFKFIMLLFLTKWHPTFSSTFNTVRFYKSTIQLTRTTSIQSFPPEMHI